MTATAHLFDYNQGTETSGPGGAPTPPDPVSNLVGGADVAKPTCSVDGCERSARARGWCPMHYSRWRHHGDPTVVLRWWDGRTSNIDVAGYRRIKIPGHPMALDRGWALEHRVVAWEVFGPFDPSMHVHHKNHNKLDNRPENLELLTPSEHSREHTPRSVPVDVWVDARRRGLSYPAIGRITGHNNGTVYKALARWRREHPGEVLP